MKWREVKEVMYHEMIPMELKAKVCTTVLGVGMIDVRAGVVVTKEKRGNQF